MQSSIALLLCLFASSRLGAESLALPTPAPYPWSQWMAMKGLPPSFIDAILATTPSPFPLGAAPPQAREAEDDAALVQLAPPTLPPYAWYKWLEMKGLPPAIIEAAKMKTTTTPSPIPSYADFFLRAIVEEEAEKAPKKKTKAKAKAKSKVPPWMAFKTAKSTTASPIETTMDPINYAFLAQALFSAGKE